MKGECVWRKDHKYCWKTQVPFSTGNPRCLTSEVGVRNLRLYSRKRLAIPIKPWIWFKRRAKFCRQSHQTMPRILEMEREALNALHFGKTENIKLASRDFLDPVGFWLVSGHLILRKGANNVFEMHILSTYIMSSGLSGYWSRNFTFLYCWHLSSIFSLFASLWSTTKGNTSNPHLKAFLIYSFPWF